jgi:hypothetical protein
VLAQWVVTGEGSECYCYSVSCTCCPQLHYNKLLQTEQTGLYGSTFVSSDPEQRCKNATATCF